MKATAHKEVYRPLERRPASRGLGAWPVFTSSLRVATKRKLPMLLLLAVPAIATCVVSFMVYLKFAAEEEVLPEAFGGPMGAFAQGLARQATKQLEARNQIISFHAQMNMFALLCAAWYGSGLFCDDRRTGAFQLYFSRPMTRAGYFLGKLLTVALFGALVSLAPALVIFTVASFASPEWAFFKAEWDLLPRSFAFSVVWLGLVCSLTLFASSCASRKSFALLGIFCFMAFSTAVGGVLGNFANERLYAVSVLLDMQAIAHHVFERGGSWRRVEFADAYYAVGGLTALFFLGLALRLRRQEVVE